MDILNAFLLPILKAFRLKNPKTWFFVLMILGGLNYILQSAITNPTGVSQFFVEAAKWVSLIFVTLSNPDLQDKTTSKPPQ